MSSFWDLYIVHTHEFNNLQETDMYTYSLVFFSLSDQQWHYNNEDGSCYLLSPSSATSVSEAMRACKMHGGILPGINSMNEKTIIDKMAR